jgi:hypothetical protein
MVASSAYLGFPGLGLHHEFYDSRYFSWRFHSKNLNMIDVGDLPW